MMADGLTADDGATPRHATVLDDAKCTDKGRSEGSRSDPRWSLVRGRARHMLMASSGMKPGASKRPTASARSSIKARGWRPIIAPSKPGASNRYLALADGDDSPHSSTVVMDADTEESDDDYEEEICKRLGKSHGFGCNEISEPLESKKGKANRRPRKKKKVNPGGKPRKINAEEGPIPMRGGGKAHKSKVAVKNRSQRPNVDLDDDLISMLQKAQLDFLKTDNPESINVSEEMLRNTTKSNGVRYLMFVAFEKAKRFNYCMDNEVHRSAVEADFQWRTVKNLVHIINKSGALRPFVRAAITKINKHQPSTAAPVAASMVMGSEVVKAILADPNNVLSEDKRQYRRKQMDRGLRRYLERATPKGSTPLLEQIRAMEDARLHSILTEIGAIGAWMAEEGVPFSFDPP